VLVVSGSLAIVGGFLIFSPHLVQEIELNLQNIGEKRPAYDFVYAYGSLGASNEHDWSIKNGKLILSTSTHHFWGIYHTENDQKESIDIAALQGLDFTNSTTSPDGFAYTMEYKPCVFGHGPCPPQYLIREFDQTKRRIVIPGLEFIGVPIFVGWIAK